MGGPRGSTIRRRESGKVCWSCGRILEPPYPGRERACDACTPRRNRVSVQFFLRHGWVVNFLTERLDRAIGPIRTYENFEAIRGMFDRRAESRVLADKQALDEAERTGRGSFWVLLSDEEVGRLQRR